MINLKSAYRTAKAMGRSPKNTELDTVQVTVRKSYKDIADECVVAYGVCARGTTGVKHKALIVFDYEPGSKLTKVFRMSKRKKVAPLARPYNAFITCDCDDFLFTFYKQVAKDGGSAKKLVVPKPKGTGVKRSIDTVGMCKHLMALTDHLKATGYIK